MAADVLRAAGMVEGVNYRRQVAMVGGRVPDFTFLLPKGLEMNMDVKFPIDNYLRYLDATSDGDRSTALSAFQRDVRGRVKEITTRDYIDPERTVDHVLLFIPNESVYSFIHENDSELLDRAMAEKVGVVVEARFTDRDDLGVVEQRGDAVESLRRVVRMHTRSGPHVVVGLGHSRRDQRMLEVGANRDERGYACGAGLCDQLVIVDTQMAVVVDPRHASLSP